MAHPSVRFAKGWDSVLLRAAAVATKRSPISCKVQEDRNPGKLEVGDAHPCKTRKGGRLA